ncbi:MAG TPA: serine--tRNA ligase [Candidatus Paceibacterota bacterium]|nr:serine--tRNA ligase [Candidatus Paceibacterota bacterium]HRZ34387.1 serine--tRNA ligase [Candidatus Paceibacterota bacterium]
MLDIKFVKENKDLVLASIKNRNVKTPIDLDRLIELSKDRSRIRQQIDELNQKRNQAAKDKDIELGKKLKEEGAKLEAEFNKIDKEYFDILILIPNIPSADTPVGPDSSGNKVLRQFGEKPKFDFKPREHFDLGKELGIIDNEKAGEVSGARFTYLKGDLARMQLAIMNLATSLIADPHKNELKEIIAKNDLQVPAAPFCFVIPPTLIKPAVLNRMARLEPREDRYHLPADDLYLVGSAEHTLGPLHMDETLAAESLPIRYLGYSTSYRREAGTYGKDTRGILRVHQFDKLEMEVFCLPEDSYKEQELMVSIQETLLKKLGLPYQVVLICTGDMGSPDHRQIDIETWMPGQNCYRETHTTDLTTSYQSRRLNTKFKNKDGKPEYVHMVDGTLVAIGRILIAIMENYQQKDGSIKIPEILIPEMGQEFIQGKKI